MSRRIRRWMPMGLAVGVASTGFAFMAANTVPATNAGTAETNISGYTASNVHYTLDVANDPEDVLNVKFHLAADNPPQGGAPAPATVMIELKKDAGTFSCTNDSNNWANSQGDYTCDLPVTPPDSIDVGALVELAVIAAQ